MNKKIKIAYISKFSNQNVRERLDLSEHRLRNFLFRLFQRPVVSYSDIYIWNSDFIEEFEKRYDFESHVIATHNGMRKKIQEFNINNIHYHFVKCDNNVFIDALRAWSHYDRITNFSRIRRPLSKVIDAVNPDVIIVCGAEQPDYSPCIWDIHGKPVYVLLQSLINNPELKNTLPGFEIYSSVERRTFEQIDYFGSCNEKMYNLFRQFNQKAVCLKTSFPTHRPKKISDIHKNIDFIFFAATISKNKGIEDVLKAYNIVRSLHPEVTLSICGRCSEDYLNHLTSLIEPQNQNGFRYEGFFDSIDESHAFVQSGKIIVVPGISAPLNSTIREAMLLGLPTIAYETTATVEINLASQCLITAKMEDFKDLADKMLYAYENPSQLSLIANNGFLYANEHYSNRSIVDEMLKNTIAVYDHYYKGAEIPQQLIYTPNLSL